MIQYLLKIDGQLQSLDESRPGCWINISPPFNQEELEKVSRQFDLPLDFLTDSLDIDERSRYEREEDIRLIVVNTPILNESDREDEAVYITIPIGIILTVDHTITITSHHNPVLQLFLDQKVKNF
ncbi:MAG: CorA family divalent cation transporter, partial [Bacteroidota bacterium]